MASPVAEVKDGKIVSQTNTTQKTTKSNGMDKESFLQLLVAQMKYQDPLEPTSNTEYISQYAQFSQVESLQSMSSNMDLQRASKFTSKPPARMAKPRPYKAEWIMLPTRAVKLMYM